MSSYLAQASGQVSMLANRVVTIKALTKKLSNSVDQSVYCYTTSSRSSQLVCRKESATVAINVFGIISHPRFKRKSLESLGNVLRTGGTPISAIVEKWAPLDLVNAFQCQEATRSYPIETLTDQKLKRLRNGIKKAEQSPS